MIHNNTILMMILGSSVFHKEVMKAWMEGNNPNYEVSWDSLYELLKATNCTQVAEELKIAVENYSEHN